MVVNVKNASRATQGLLRGLLVVASEGVGRAGLLESVGLALVRRDSAPSPTPDHRNSDGPTDTAGDHSVASLPIVGSIAQLRGVDLDQVEMVICAARLIDGSGLDALNAIRAHRPHMPVIITGDRVDAGLAIPVIRAGASDFVILEEGDATGLVIAVEKCFAQQRVQRENDRLRDELRQSLAELEIKNRELELVINQLEVKARTDALTGLSNRRWLSLMLQGAWAEASRHDMPLGCLMIDLDGFKALNDQAGHQRGDEVLQAAGRIIQENCREVDVKARFGGDEFCILMPHTEAHESMVVAERIRSAFAEYVKVHGHAGVPLGMSIGLAHREMSQPESPDGLILHADEALYAAKAAGKGRVIVRGMDGVFAPMTRG